MRTNKNFSEKWCHSEKKTNNERTKWIVQINEIIIVFKNERKKTTNNLKLEEQTFYWTNEYFFPHTNDCLKKLKFFILQKILLYKRFYWTNDITEQSFSEKANRMGLLRKMNKLKKTVGIIRDVQCSLFYLTNLRFNSFFKIC